jgi:hypothetical protein
MADRVRKVSYCYALVPNRPGQGAKLLGALKEAGVNLLGYTGFPAKAGKAQLDLVAERLAPIQRVAARHGWKLSAPKKGFLVQGKDEPGAVFRTLEKLAAAGINVVAANAASSGEGRFGMLLWVRPRDYARASKALGAK